MKNQLDLDKQRKVCQDYLNGNSMTALASKNGYSYYLVRKTLLQNNLKIRGVKEIMFSEKNPAKNPLVREKLRKKSREQIESFIKMNKNRTESHKKNLRNALLLGYKNGTIKKLSGSNHPMFGKHLSLETKEKIRKKLSERHKGEGNPAWKGGVSYEGYDTNFNRNFRNAIRKRDNQVCMNCGKHKEKLNYPLNVHHINYDKTLSIQENCITLCHQCHSFTNNNNREYWTKLFQEKLSKLYGYKYSEDGKVIFELNAEAFDLAKAKQEVN